MTRFNLFAVWFVVLITGLALFMFFPDLFEPLLCEEGERIAMITRDIVTADGDPGRATDMACLNAVGDTRFVGEKVGVPFALIMTIIAFALASKRFDKFLGIKETGDADNNSDDAEPI